MTNVRALPPVPCAPPNAVSVPRGNDNPQAITSSHEFRAILKAQSKPSQASHDPAASFTRAEQTIDAPREPNIEAMLQQLLVCRKMRLHSVLDACDPNECQPELSTTAPMLPANIVIWVPVDIRTPRHSNKALRRRRRGRRAPDGYRYRV